MKNSQAVDPLFLKDESPQALFAARTHTALIKAGAAVENAMVIVQADYEPMPGVEKPCPHQIYRHSRVSVQKRPLAELHPADIRVEMLYAGVCGTDVHLLTNNAQNGYICCSAPCDIPAGGRVMGHEGVGRVIAAGSYIQHVKPGDFITMESIMVCNACKPCKKGKFNQCAHAKLIGLEIDGVFGSVVDIPGMIAHDITALIKSEHDLQALACIEPASVAYVACENAKITPGDVVLIFGAGPIGVLAAMLSRDVFGASEVHIVEPVAFRRKFAEQWADKVYDEPEAFIHTSRRVDRVFEASGYLENVTRVFRKINPNGSVVLLARSGNPFFMEHVDHMITNEIAIVGSRGHLGGAFSNILSLYEREKISPGDIVTKILNGPEQLCALFNEKEKILNENCKILVKLSDLHP